MFRHMQTTVRRTHDGRPGSVLLAAKRLGEDAVEEEQQERRRADEGGERDVQFAKSIACSVRLGKWQMDGENAPSTGFALNLHAAPQRLSQVLYNRQS